jgi:hypothetical protein
VTCEDQNQTILRVPISRRADLFELYYIMRWVVGVHHEKVLSNAARAFVPNASLALNFASSCRGGKIGRPLVSK